MKTSIIKQRFQAAALTVLLGVTTTAANAATVSLSGPTSITPGQSFTLAIDASGFGAGLFGGGFDILVNGAELASSFSWQPGGPSGGAFSCLPGEVGCGPDQVTVVTTTGDPDNDMFNGTGGGPFVFVNLTDIGIGAGNSSTITLADNSAALGGWLASDFSTYNPTFGTHTVTVVPVPAAVWLFASGLLGLVGVARRRKAA